MSDQAVYISIKYGKVKPGINSWLPHNCLTPDINMIEIAAIAISFSAAVEIVKWWRFSGT